MDRIIPFFLQTLVWVPTRFSLIFFCRLKVEGLEHLRVFQGPAIFAPNHISELDPILVPASLPLFSRFRPLFYVARRSYESSIRGIRKYLYGGAFFQAWGAYPTLSGKRDYEASLAKHRQLLQRGASVCIFPEGKISDSGEFGVVHGGVSFLSENAQVPVVPVKIRGLEGLTLEDILFRRRFATVTFLSPVFPEAHESLPHRERAEQIMSPLRTP